MSYCCMQNTVGNLTQCIEQLEEKGFDGLSEQEHKAAKRLLKLCEKFIANFEEEA